VNRSRPIILGNWKMNGLISEADALASSLAELMTATGGQGTLGIFPPATVLLRVAEKLRGTGIIVGSQDCHEHQRGAFTGSISASMLKNAGASAVLVGHSERRLQFGESDQTIRAKAQAALDVGLVAVVCIGETEKERRAGLTLERLKRQIDLSTPRRGDPRNLIIAYEPIWAIGTGISAREDDIARAHAAIREGLMARGGSGASIPILYGGSVKADNVSAILATEGVDGVLAGGASLDAKEFWSIFKQGRSG
jgi:triosephosphate isomerase